MRTPGPVVVALELGPRYEAALREAHALAAGRLVALPLFVVHALDLRAPLAPTGMDMALPVPLPSGPEQLELQQATLAALRERMAQAGADGEALVAEGVPSEVVVAYAGGLNAELLVAGTRGRTGLARLALGSVAESLLAAAPLSVLVVRLGA